MTHCIPAARADSTPLGASSKTRTLAGLAGGGLNLWETYSPEGEYLQGHGVEIWLRVGLALLDVGVVPRVDSDGDERRPLLQEGVLQGETPTTGARTDGHRNI